MMLPLRWLSAVALVALTMPSEAQDVRDNNGGNCDGVKSCRPRCITFRIDRDKQLCDSSNGIFSVASNLNPWDVPEFKTSNCDADNTCVDHSCDMDLNGDLTVRIGEFGASGSLYYSSIFLPDGGDERFTYCSVYPCPKEECAVPEQMVRNVNCIRCNSFITMRRHSCLRLLDRDLAFSLIFSKASWAWINQQSMCSAW